MKNFTTCLTRPTGESYKSPGGIMRYMMLLLMFLVAGVGMAQDGHTNFSCVVSGAKDRWTTKDMDGITVTFSEAQGDNGFHKVTKDGTITIESDSKNITSVEIFDNQSKSGEFKSAGTSILSGALECETFSSNKVTVISTTDVKIIKIVVYYTTDGGGTTQPNITIGDYTPTLTTQVGTQFTLTVNADVNVGDLTYQWYRAKYISENSLENEETLSGSTNKYTYTPIDGNEGIWRYRCRVTSTANTEISKDADFTVTVSPKSTEPYLTVNTPETNIVKIKKGASYIFSIDAAGYSGLEYTWVRSKNGIDEENVQIYSNKGSSVTLEDLEGSSAEEGTTYYGCRVTSGELSKDIKFYVTVESETVSEGSLGYKCGTGGVISTSTYDDNVNDIHFKFYDKDGTEKIDQLKTDYFRFVGNFTVTSTKYEIDKIVIQGVGDNPSPNDENGNKTDNEITTPTTVELVAGGTDDSSIKSRSLSCEAISGGGLNVINNASSSGGIYVKNIIVYYKEKNTTEEDYGIIIDHQNDVSVKSEGALTFKIAAHPDNTAGRKYEWFINTKDSYDGGTLLGSSGGSKEYSFVVPQEEGDYWYYSILTCRDQNTGNTVVYKSNRIHVIVTGIGDGLVIVTPIENVETTVYKQTKISLEVNEEDGCTYEYQWYKANGNSNVNGTAIENATKRIYTFTPENVGTEYYYCVITRKENGTETGTLTSRVGRVNITKATPDIDINDMRLVLNDGAKTFNIKATVGDETKTNVTDKLTFKCDVTDENVATASISGKVLTVTPVKVGTTEITITSAANDNFNKSEVVATITVAESANTVPNVLFKWAKGPADNGPFNAPETEEDAYEGNVLLVRFAPDLPGVDYDGNGWTGINFDNTSGNWTTTDGKKYQIYYVISDNENVKNGTLYKGSLRISQTMTVKAIVKDVTESSAKWGDACEHTFLFNFTLLKTITNGLQIEAGKGYSLMDNDGRVYVTTTYGSVGDMGDPTTKNNVVQEQELWAPAKKDSQMNDSEIVGFDYHSIGNKDAKGENKWNYATHEYAENQYKYDGEADNKDLNTFDIPFTGAYFMFEPEVDGELNVIVRQNGIVGSNGDNLTKEVKKVVNRYAFVCDETGKSLPAVDKPEDYGKGVRALISTKSLTESKGFAFLDTYTETVNETDNVLDEKGQQKEVIVREIPKEDSDKKLKKYMEAFYKAQHDESEYTAETLSENAVAYWNECRSKYLPKAESSDKDCYTIGDEKYKKVNCDLPNMLAHDEYGWYTFGKAYVRYSFPVKAGKTYFMMGRWTKLAPCGYSFKRNNKDYNNWKEEISTRKITVDGKHLADDADRAELINYKKYDDIIYYTDKTDDNGNIIEGEKEEYARSTEHHITLDREFRAGVWTSLVLPFSMSPTSVKEQFGIGTQIVHFNMVDNNKLYLTKHHHQMIVAGTPVFIKPTKKVSKVVVYGTYGQYETVKNDNGELVNQWKFPKIWEMDGNTDNGWKMKGSYTPARVPVGAYLMGYNPDSKVNNLRHITMSTDVPGTRAWIVNESAAQEAKIEGLYINGVEDNTTTVIEEILYGEEPSTAKGTRANGVYSLSGQLVRANTTDTTGLPAGIYIAGGRKVVVR